jgi:hypothetical protein
MADRMRILARGAGPVWVDVEDVEEASDLGSYWNAVRHFLRTGDDFNVSQFEGMVVGGYELETDPDEIEFWSIHGELEFEDIYEGV